MERKGHCEQCGESKIAEFVFVKRYFTRLRKVSVAHVCPTCAAKEEEITLS